MGRFSNISISRYRKILSALGLEYVRTTSGHEMWYKEGMLRDAVFQTHIDPVPEVIIRNNNRSIGISSKDFEKKLAEIR